MIEPSLLSNFYTLTVGVAGFLLPVFQAVLLFVTEKSFNRLEVTRQELIGFYRKQGAVLSICLVFLIVQPIFLLLDLWLFAKIFLVIFVMSALIARIILLHDTGVWATMFSTKFIPRGSKAYRYLRTCLNNDLPAIVNALFFLVVLSLPFLFDQLLAVSILSILIYTVVTIATLLNNPTAIQQSLLRTENTGYELGSEESRWSEEKAANENKVISAHLKVNAFYTQDTAEDSSRLFTYNTNWFVKQDNGEFWCNIWISTLSIPSLDKLRARIETIVKEQMIDVAEAKTDVNSFVFSFHFKIGDELRNAFFRSNKEEIKALKHKSSSEFVQGIKNKLFDEVLL